MRILEGRLSAKSIRSSTASRERSRSESVDRRPKVDPERARAFESLRLARTELQRQLEATTHPVRREQIQHAVAEIDRQLAAMN